MIAVGIESVHPQEVAPAVGTVNANWRAPTRDFGPEIQLKAALSYHVVRQVRRHLLPDLVLSDNVIADDHALADPVRVGVDEHELQHQRVVGPGLEDRPC